MKTIRWLVESLPQSVRTLFAVLMIAIMSLSSIVVYLNNKYDAKVSECEHAIEKLNSANKRMIDSLNVIIEQKNDKEVITLLNIIAQQKMMIEAQTKQAEKLEVERKRNDAIIKTNNEKLNKYK